MQIGDATGGAQARSASALYFCASRGSGRPIAHGCRGSSRCTRDVAGSPADNAVAFAGDVFQPHRVEDHDVAPPISYHPVSLEPVRNDRHTGTADTQYLGNGLLLQRELARSRQVERLQQLARKAGFKMVQSIAGSSLMNLAEQRLLKSQNDVSDALTLTDGGAKMGFHDDCAGGR